MRHEDLDFHVYMHVVSFEIILCGKNKFLQHENKGEYFTGESRSFLKNASSGDLVIIRRIKGYMIVKDEQAPVIARDIVYTVE